MNPTLDRRTCLTLLPSAAVVVAFGRDARACAQPDTSSYEGPEAAMRLLPAQDPARVREMVGASHRNIDRVRELLKETPQLANATFDWGFGDWETALGAASHVGRREIADLLMEHGARPDIFTFTMLGMLDAVRAMVVARPGIQRTRGPHGLNLMHHARAGGDEAKAVLEYLSTLEGADVAYTNLALEPALETAYIGTYAFGPGKNERFEIAKQEGQKQLTIQRTGRFVQRLFHLGNHAFHPTGAPDVRITFTIANDRATALAVTAPLPVIEAKRV